MSVKNLMEDIITNTVEEVLKNESDEKISKSYKEDILAYVLNRIHPRYITSERGIIHGKLDSRFLFQEKSDILFLIHEAIQVIKSRRATTTHMDENAGKSMFLPHIIGETLEETTFSIIPEVEVTLIYKGKTADMIDDGWRNPYLINSSTMGYYHFMPIFSEKEMGGKKEIPFTLCFKHKKFQDKEIGITLKPVDSLNLHVSYVIPLVLLQIKDGVDVSFLYE